MNIKSLFQKPKKLNNELNSNTESEIEIIIENHSHFFQNEETLIKENAKIWLESGHVDSYEEGIIVFATMVRGLKYIRTDIQDGRKIVLLKERE